MPLLPSYARRKKRGRQREAGIQRERIISWLLMEFQVLLDLVRKKIIFHTKKQENKNDLTTILRTVS